jgi:transcriptional regulator with XRE-family HTH domain
MPLGERLRRRREELGLSQRELARRLGIRHATISDLERRVQKDVSLGLLRKLAKTLGVTADWLIGMYEDEEESEGADVALVG